MVTLAASLLFLHSFYLICLAESDELCRPVISQLREVKVFSGARATTLPCNITHRCPRMGAHVRWFVFRHDDHREINPRPPKYSTEGRALTIHSPQSNDSGEYYCSIAERSGTKMVPCIGNGTRLVVRNRNNTTTQTALLWMLFAILAVYSLIILLLLICKKARRELFRSKRRKTPGKKSSSRRKNFHAVVQELYKKRNLQSAGQNTARTHPRRSKIEHPHAYSPDEDVYQNIG